ncbi:hypothetical protein GCM10011507_16990 [Edaphobacter acidisoli]|uniref:histidine kinase n=1 Tax=Edaphobacter acidisoli TaxID=2040573 RepID=A0A916RTV9_9BACT|nr:ATP-binding protein [Edaphobacter acidisoli]GGA65989.1 hypothetical protein GCM10011507_16990 [Edaphobacter acidisoli]
MRLKTKLVLWLTALMFAIVLLLSALFVGELLRQRIEQTAATNDVMAHEVLLATRSSVELGLRQQPPTDTSDKGVHDAVVLVLQQQSTLIELMNAIVRYSPTVQDVSVTDAYGTTIISTDPDAVGHPFPFRTSLTRVQTGGMVLQTREVFGPPRVLDISQTLERNGFPFLIVHVGVRSTFLKNSYEPWLRAALWFALLAGLASMVAAALTANAALRPIEQISSQLERLTLRAGEGAEPTPAASSGSDAVVRVAKTISRLGEQMRSTEAGYSALQANLNQMLDTLRDGVMLFTADRRAVMVSDAVAYFLNSPAEVEGTSSSMVGKQLEEIFLPGSALGEAVLAVFDSGEQASVSEVTLEDGRQVQVSVDRIEDERGGGSMGTLLTLRDTESAAQLGQELEISRRLAAIGRLTAGVGHEVKNPINAMVVHLELLRGKLAGVHGEAAVGAQRHVEILAGEMQRLDRVVQTLADFSRPMELHLRDRDLRHVVGVVVELTAAEMQENGVRVQVDEPRDPLMVRVDGELIQQALLNLVLNAMQAMKHGGNIEVRVRRDHQFAVVEVADDGEGIPPEVLPRIFELYFTTKPKGSGIGLAMTYRILQMHGGTLDVRSNTDAAAGERGTVFTFRLPVAGGTVAGTAANRKVMGERV